MKHNLFSPSPWGRGVNKSCIFPSFRREDTSLKTRSALLLSVFFMKFYISRNSIHFTVSSVINRNAEEEPWSGFGMFSSDTFNSWLINLNLWSRNDSFLQEYWFVMDIQTCGGSRSVLCGRTTATWTGCSRLLQCGPQMESQVAPLSPHLFSSSGVGPSETLILDIWHEPLLLLFCWWVWATIAGGDDKKGGGGGCCRRLCESVVRGRLWGPQRLIFEVVPSLVCSVLPWIRFWNATSRNAVFSEEDAKCFGGFNLTPHRFL